MNSYLDFEKPIAEIEGKIQELRHLSDENSVNMIEEVFFRLIILFPE